MAFNYEREIENLSQTVLSGEKYLQEQAANMSRLYVDLLQAGGLVPKNSVERLGVVLIGPSVMEITGMQMAMKVLGIEADITGIEYQPDTLAQLALKYGASTTDTGKAVDIRKGERARITINDGEVTLIPGDAAKPEFVDDIKRRQVDGYVVFAGNMGLHPNWTGVMRNWAGLMDTNKPVLYAGTAHAPYGNAFDPQVMAAESYFTMGLQPSQREGMKEITLQTEYGTNPHAFLPGKDFPYNHAFDFAYVWHPQRKRRLQG